MNTRTITAAALAAGMLFQAQGLTRAATLSGNGADPAPATADPAPATADPEAAAHEIWHSVVAHNTPPAKGCFHVAYPNYSWESVDCKETQTHVHPVHVNRATGAPEVVGNGNDYAAEAQGLISYAQGELSLSGVTSVTSVGVASFGDEGILGANEYSLQLNTNANGSTSACAGHSGCTVWQQFIYATDYNNKGQGALFMQYWLLDWGSSTCPSGWRSSASGTTKDCYKNSKSLSLPDIPVTHLGNVLVNAAATPGGNDVLILDYAGNGSTWESWYLSAEDSVAQGGVDISSVWHEAEYNVVGDAGGSQAQFNYGSSIAVQLNIIDGSNVAPACASQAGTTGETNNLNLGSCQVGVYLGIDPDIKFTETLPFPIIWRL